MIRQATVDELSTTGTRSTQPAEQEDRESDWDSAGLSETSSDAEQPLNRAKDFENIIFRSDWITSRKPTAFGVSRRHS